MQSYEALEMEVIKFETEDVITTSNDPPIPETPEEVY